MRTPVVMSLFSEKLTAKLNAHLVIINEYLNLVMLLSCEASVLF